MFLKYSAANVVLIIESLSVSPFFHFTVAFWYVSLLLHFLLTFLTHSHIALSEFIFSSLLLGFAINQSFNLLSEYTLPSSSNLSIFPMRIGRTSFLPFNL